MIPKSVRNVKNKELVTFYHSYEGEKTKYPNFLNRVKNLGYSYEKAIKDDFFRGKHLIK